MEKKINAVNVLDFTTLNHRSSIPNRFHKIVISNGVANNIMCFRILFVRPPNLHWQLIITK